MCQSSFATTNINIVPLYYINVNHSGYTFPHLSYIFYTFPHLKRALHPVPKANKYILMCNHKQIIKKYLEILKTYYILHLVSSELKSRGCGTIPCDLSNYDRAFRSASFLLSRLIRRLCFVGNVGKVNIH